ncbi:MAG: Nramp family divalent metal transporter [Planctomycetaceae bacterium]
MIGSNPDDSTPIRIDWSVIAFLSALIAISGSGGLSNTPISNYTRDQGWGMGHHVGAIPSIVGGQNIQLSHVGVVFEPNAESLPRWKRWYKHIVRDQLVVWMPACFFGLALPSMLSVEFPDRGTVVATNGPLL